MVDLSNARVLMIATDGFEQDELFGPRQALLNAGVKVTLASLKSDAITGEKGARRARALRRTRW
jgi:protease I